MKKLTKYLTGILFGTFVFGTTAFAAEVTPVSGVGYTTENTEIRTEASMTGALILTKEQCPDNIGVAITGVTDTGFWEVDLGQEQKFYVEGAGLVNINGSQGQTAGAADTNTAIVNDNIPIEELSKRFKEYNEAGRNPNETEIQQMKELYRLYVQAVDKLLNGTTNVTYYSDDTGIKYPLYVRIAVGSYFRKLYPSYTVNYDWRTGYAYAEKYVSDFNIIWG